MSVDIVEILKTGNSDRLTGVLITLNNQSAIQFSNSQDKQLHLDALFNRISRDESPQIKIRCLETIRIISRDKADLDHIIDEKKLRVLAHLTGLDMYAGLHTGEMINIINVNDAIVIEAQKVLSNIIYNSHTASRICCENGCIEGIIQRLKTYKDPELIHDIKFYDMRILFILTALHEDIRPKVRMEMHGLTYLIEVLDLILQKSKKQNDNLTDDDINLCIEILKILFTLSISDDKQNADEDEIAIYMRVVSVIHDILIIKYESKEKCEELQSHAVNLLTNMPPKCYVELMTPMMDDEFEYMQDVEYDRHNMQAILALLEFMDRRLEQNEKNNENLTPILCCLCECSQHNRAIRKYCRLKVLPYMKDEVKYMPSEGGSYRNKLIRLLSSNLSSIGDMASDFLFTLCKENVSRFIKYTGFGNAAGLLHKRGLMRGGCTSSYSSESDDSETEEYNQLKTNVNMVTGKYEEEKRNPLEGMSEEQKEYEAMKLVNTLDKLSRTGVVQPCRVGEDGSVQPVEHVLEMLNINDNDDEDSDEDD